MLDSAKKDGDVQVTRRDGQVLEIKPLKVAKSPLDIKGALPKGFLNQLELALMNATQITSLTQQFKKALIESALIPQHERRFMGFRSSSLRS